eukprot:5435771-Amphidinium_carterae.1
MICAGLEIALQRFRAMQCRDGIESWDDQYVDDGVIECAHSDIERAYANLEAALGPSGLRPASGAGPVNVQGLTLCGKPIWEGGASDRAVPVGVT